MGAAFLNAIFDQAVQNPNFFNGKVLTARDMQDVQAATLEHDRRLGQAIGAGVAYGLFVQKKSGTTSLIVSAGLAVNRRGDLLLLPSDVTLPLQATTQAASSLDSPFAACDNDTTSSSINAGFYLLALTVATQASREQAQHTGLNTSSGTICISRYDLEGVQFKLIPIDTSIFTPSGNSDALYQNQLANACFGTATLLANLLDPFHVPAYYGVVDALFGADTLQDCDVPLAVLRYTGSQLPFVDQWAVRRPCYGVSATASYPLAVTGTEPFPQHASARRRVEAQAMLLQFQDQLTSVPHTADSASYFAYLPSAGYLPLGSSAFSLSSFFPKNTNTPRDVDPAYVRLIFQQSFFIEPVQVTAGQPVNVEFLNVTGSDNSYIIFARQEVVTVTPPDSGSQPTQTQEDGVIVVMVMDAKGESLFAKDIAAVRVSSPNYTSTEKASDALYTGKRGIYGLAAENQIRRYYEDALNTVGREAIYEESLIAFYVFRRPPGTYTVTVTPQTSTGLRAGSASVTLASGQTKAVKVTLREPVSNAPQGGGKVTGGSKVPLVVGDGYSVNNIYLYPDWNTRFPHYRPGDPPPGWIYELPDDLQAAINDVLSQYLSSNPLLAVDGTQFFADPGYDPTAVRSDPYAFLKTGDGQSIPVIFAAGDYSVVGDVSVGQTNLPDLDTYTQNVLRDSGLDDLNAFNGAWTGLVSGLLKLDDKGAASLLSETRSAGQGLANSFTRYPGVDAQADAALKQAGIGDDMTLANAPLAQVQGALGANYSAGFAERLIDRARSNLPTSAWSLASLDLDGKQLTALANQNIDSLGEFVNAAGQQHDALATSLNLSGTALDQITTQARAGTLATRLDQAGSIGVAEVPTVTSSLGAALVNAGYKTASDLANADVTQLAQKANLSQADATALKQSAADKIGTFNLLQSALGLSDKELNTLKDAGITSARDLVVSKAVVNQVIGAQRGAMANDLAGQMLNVSGRLG